MVRFALVCWCAPLLLLTRQVRKIVTILVTILLVCRTRTRSRTDSHVSMSSITVEDNGKRRPCRALDTQPSRETTTVDRKRRRCMYQVSSPLINSSSGVASKSGTVVVHRLQGGTRVTAAITEASFWSIVLLPISLVKQQPENVESSECRNNRGQCHPS